ncbi:MAG: histidinol-phosphate transaminase [Deltaproteobacteria bacterium]|nr:histidinol-phosphate transaminase [Deltaproteobacteria bacterium]
MASQTSMTSLIRSEIVALKKYKLAARPEAIKLNQNEMPYDIPGDIKAKVLEKLVLIPWNRYPFSQPYSLLNKLSEFYHWPSEGIAVVNGSNVLIQAIVLATSLKSRVLALDPSFSLYELEAKALGNKVDLIPLGENFSFPLKAILEKIEKTPPSLIFLANPNAPTANLFPKEEILQVIQKAKCLVVVDEAYCHFADYDLLSELPSYKNLILLRTFSKGYGLGGVRLGLALGHEEIISEISKVLLPYCVSALNEVLVESVLDHPELLEKRVTTLKINRSWLYQAMCAVPHIKVYTSQTNFIIFQLQDAEKTFQDLLNEGVLIRNVSTPSLPHTLRVSVGTQEENEKFVKALEKVMKNHK